MAKLRSRKDLANFYKKQSLVSNPNTPLGVATALRSGKSRGGYIGRLARLQKKTPGQLRGLPGSGPRIRDWMTGYED